ncbi:MAG: hypothetical protein QOF90_1851, partial [Acetobacteraceae bacterium]|nr:hypothetical protein [Acetobacteraceae bacterium]
MGMVTPCACLRLSGIFVHFLQAGGGLSVGPEASHPDRCL